MSGASEIEWSSIVVDRPRERVHRVTLNRPDRRNAIDNVMRGELLDALHRADADDDVRLTVVRGAGKCFSSGYDLGSDLSADRPYETAPGPAGWARHVQQGWMSIWDLAKPVIAQVHGYAMAGGSELAAACDLVYIEDQAKVSHPVVRVAGTPDFAFHPWLVGMRNAMEQLLTGDPVTGEMSVQMGFANRAFPIDTLEDEVLAIAERIAQVPAGLLRANKRTVHAAMDAMGARAAIRAATDIQAVLPYLDDVKENLADIGNNVKRQAASATSTGAEETTT